MSDSRTQQELFELPFRPGSWFQFPTWIFKLRPTNTKGKEIRIRGAAALTLAALFSQAAKLRASRNDGWFTFSIEDAESLTGNPKTTQEDHLRAFEEVCYVERRRQRAEGAAREIRLNYEAVIRSLEEAGELTGGRPKSGNPDDRNPGIRRPKSGRPLRTSGVDGVEVDQTPNSASGPLYTPRTKKGRQNLSASTFDKDCAKQLQDALVRSGVMSACSPARVKSWPASFLGLREEFGEEDVRRHLDWYCRHVGEEFVPEADSAESFAKKFLRIRMARKRILGNSSGDNRPAPRMRQVSSVEPDGKTLRFKYEPIEDEDVE